VKRKDFVKALDALDWAVSSKPIVEEMGCYRIRGKNLRASDGALLVQVELSEDTGLDCTVPASGFKKLLKDLKQDDVTLKIDKGKLAVVVDRVRGRFALATSSDKNKNLLDDLSFDAETWQPATAQLKAAVKMCRFAASKDVSKGVYCGVILKDGNAALATDKLRIGWFRAKTDISAESVVLPAAATALLDKRAAEIEEWAVSNGTIYFRGKGVTWGSRIPAGDYTSKVWEYVKMVDDLKDKVELPASMLDMLRRHLDQQSEVLEMDRAVTLAFSGKELKVASTDGVRYEMEETAELAEAVAAEFAFEIKPQCLIDILATTSTMLYDATSSKDGDGNTQLKTPFVAFRALTAEGEHRYLTTIEGK